MTPKKESDRKAKAPAKKRDLTERERGAIVALANRRADLAPPRFEKNKNGEVKPNEPTNESSAFYARLAQATGTNSFELSARMLEQIGRASITPDDDVAALTNANAAVLAGIRPENELEGLLATQMAASHGFALELMRRATAASYVPQTQMYGNLAAKFLRLFVDQTDALARVRGKAGKQTVRVEHVHVESGAQAIVGNVAHGGEGGRENRESTP